jgi:hypothetical protein
MKKFFILLFLICILTGGAVMSDTDIVLEPFTYSENFETRSLRSWASYPPWQDTAYDPNIRVNEMVPGDPNISIEQKVTPYTNVDNYAGVQKLFDAYLVPGSSITLRYYLKTHLPAEFFKIRLAGGPDSKVDVTVPNPPLNRWEWITVTFEDFVRENPCLAGRDRIRVNALAVLTKIPDADPAMRFFLGIDDVTLKGARAMAFQFAEPAVYKLSEWKPYIPRKHYYKGDTFNLNGRWPLNAGRVEISITQFADETKTILTSNLRKKGDRWELKPLKLTYPEGLYLGKLRAYRGSTILSETEFTLHIAPQNIAGKHPRLWFDDEKKQWIMERLKSDRFSDVYNSMPENAAKQRENVPVESLVFDMDQFPDETWLPTWSAWGSHLYPTDSALYWNSLAWVFHDDKVAGEYAKDVLVKLAKFDNWTHPWQTKRGRFNEHRTGGWSHRLALGYDLVYDLMDEDERLIVRKALMNNIVKGTHRTYVVDNNITGNTSNWIAMIAGGSLMVQSAMFGDGPDVEVLEPYFTGAMLKFYTFIRKVTDSDGAWGEGLGYNNYSFRNMSNSMPSLLNVFNIDLAKPLKGSYKEFIWAGLVKDRKYFYFGDTGGNLNPITSWAWLLDRYNDPLLGWYYNALKYGVIESNTKASIRSEETRIKKKETFEDVLYETEDVPMDDPLDENPVKVFRNVGTTVFKSGWEKDDFVFVMRTGAFYNHQHIDQGSFWIADRGTVFIEERHGSTYYDDPLYQPWYTQPVGHSTILIDGNHQSQRVGDHLEFAEGFNDHAFIAGFLDGTDAAFSSGDIGKLYWGKVKCLKRNVLYIKPRTVLMLDTVVPAERDADVTLLYQTPRLEDINAGNKISTIARDGNVLNIMHLAPEKVDAVSVETPHYLYTLRNERPLVKEGMLTVTARTDGNPLVMANILTTTTGAEPDVTCLAGDGFIKGDAGGTPFVFSVSPGRIYETGDFATDAAAFTWNGSTVFAALCTTLERNSRLLVRSEIPVTCEVSSEGMKFCLSEESEVALGVQSKPGSITVNGKRVTEFRYDAEIKAVVITLPAGEGMINF